MGHTIQSSSDTPSLKQKLTTTPHRPLLHHLNADTSWLLQLPLAPHDSSNRQWYNILIDPWFAGPQVDVHPWFSEQEHGTPSSCQTIADVEALILRVEEATTTTSDEHEDTGASSRETRKTNIDLVLISHEFTDHCHRPTLTQLPASVPILATTKAFSLVRSWGYFTNLKEVTESRAPDTNTPQPGLPDWLNIHRLTSGATDPGNLHSAILFTFSANAPEQQKEAIVYTPHGIFATSLPHFLTNASGIRTLALVHGLSQVQLGPVKTGPTSLNLGAENGLELKKVLKAKYWVATHDEDKGAKGLIGMVLRKKKWKLEELGAGEEECVDVGNGGMIVLA